MIRLNNTDLNRLLILCARLHPEPQSVSAIRSLLAMEPDWDALIARAEKEGTLPLLFHSLRSLSDLVPGPARERLKSGYLANLIRNAHVLRALEPFLTAVREAGLRVALTKGGRLASTVYKDIALRPFWDVDFIVHPSDWPGLRAILLNQGFGENEELKGGEAGRDDRLDWTYSPYFHRSGLFLEFHFNSIGLHIPFRSEAEFWSSIGTEIIGGVETSVLPPEYELCYLCLHAQQHSYEKLIWLTDIAELAGDSDLDGDRIMSICRAERIQAPVYHGLRLANALWPGSISWRLMSRFRFGPMEAAAVRLFWPESSILRRAGQTSWPYYMPSLFSLWERRSVTLALRTLARIFFPPRRWMAHVRGVPVSSPRLYLQYFRRLWRPFKLAGAHLVRSR